MAFEYEDRVCLLNMELALHKILKEIKKLSKKEDAEDFIIKDLNNLNGLSIDIIKFKNIYKIQERNDAYLVYSNMDYQIYDLVFEKEKFLAWFEKQKAGLNDV